MIKDYYIRVKNVDTPVFFDFCARTTLCEHHHSDGWISGHAGTTLFTLRMSEADRTAMALALPISIMIEPIGA